MSCSYKTKFLAFVLPVFLSSCVFYPQKIEYYTDCDVKARKLVLKAEMMQGGCVSSSGSSSGGEGCLALIVAMSAGSAIVSGSIVVVGNTVYWLEKEGKCLAKPKA